MIIAAGRSVPTRHATQQAPNHVRLAATPSITHTHTPLHRRRGVPTPTYHGTADTTDAGVISMSVTGAMLFGPTHSPPAVEAPAPRTRIGCSYYIGVTLDQ